MAWQFKRFRDAIRDVAPRAAELMDDGTPGALYFRAIRALRNTIHHRMPGIGTSGRYKGDPSLRNPVLIVEGKDHGGIIEAVTAAGWTRFVGVKSVGNDMLILRFENALMRLMNDGIPLLNDLLAATPTERMGPARYALDADDTLFPRQMREYALDYLNLRHLRTTGSVADF